MPAVATATGDKGLSEGRQLALAAAQPFAFSASAYIRPCRSTTAVTAQDGLHCEDGRQSSFQCPYLKTILNSAGSRLKIRSDIVSQAAWGHARRAAEVASEITLKGFFKSQPPDFKWFRGEQMPCLELMSKTVEEYREKELTQERKEELEKTIDKLSEDSNIRQELTRLDLERVEDGYYLALNFGTLLSTHGFDQRFQAFARSCADEIKEWSGGSGDPSASLSIEHNCCPALGKHYDPRSIQSIRLYTHHGIPKEKRSVLEAFVTMHLQQESAMIPFLGEVASHQSALLRKVAAMGMCAPRGLRPPWALCPLAARIVWSATDVQRVLGVLNTNLENVLKILHTSMPHIKSEDWPCVAKTLQGATGSQNSFVPVTDAVLVGTEPKDEGFQRDAAQLPERWTNDQALRLGLVLEGVAQLRVQILVLLQVDDAIRARFKACMLCWMLWRAAHIRWVVPITSQLRRHLEGPKDEDLKERLESRQWEALEAVDHKPRDERRVVVKVDDVRVDLTEYAKKNTHPAGQAIMRAFIDEDVSNVLLQFHSKKIKDRVKWKYRIKSKD